MIDYSAVDGLVPAWKDGVLWLTLDRPTTRNAMTVAMRQGLITAMREADSNPETRLVVITGTDPAFSSGVDLKEWLGVGGGTKVDPAAMIRAARTPVLGVINGLCYTGGLEVALSCSFLIASDRARFADTHAKVGLLPGWGMTALLPRAVGARLATQMMATGEPIGAEQALNAGLVNEVVPHDQLLERARAIAAMLCAANPRSIEIQLGLIADGEGTSLAHALSAAADAKLRWRDDTTDVGARFARRHDSPSATSN
jgi:enoyl-CoA hydratase